eukprot:s9262_g1.t1
MKFGPATLLVKQLQATGGSAPPTAASGLQDLLAIPDSTGHSASDLLAI